MTEHAVVNVRGVNGAGKTTLARQLIGMTERIREYQWQKGVTVDVRRQPGAYQEPIVFVGGYKPGVQTGGTDRVTDIRMLLPLVREFAPHAHIFMEGLILSGLQNLTRELAVAAEEAGARFYAITLATPWDQCVANVMQRRLVNGLGEQEFDPEKTMRGKARAVELAHQKLKGWGIGIDILSYNGALEACKHQFGLR